MVTSVRLVAAGGGTVIAASRWGKAKTVAQMTAILICWRRWSFPPGGTVFAWVGVTLPELAFTLPLLLGRVLVWVSVVMTVISGIQYLWNYRSCFRQAS